jgi:hypothetical protein
MKTSTLKNLTLIALFGAVLAAPAMAQQGQGMGQGMGQGPGMQNSAPGQGMGPGMGFGGGRGGKGNRGGRQGMRFNQNTTPGWALMTQQEQTDHRIKMRATKTFDECTALQTEHRAVMESRAKEKGVQLRAPRRNVCETWKAQGVIK